MALTAEQFGKALVASGLMTAEDLKASWNSLSAERRPKDGDGFAQALIDLGRLTKFQAQELLAGRGGRLQMGDYLLLAEIGAGGMGKVYKAQHRRMKRVVALKVMSSAAMQDEAAVKRFQREVEAAARLEHPNIVTAYDSGEVGKVKYLVMQFVDGGDLADFVKQHGPLPIETAVDYVLQAARGLAFAHAAGVVHRDIKPANLLLDKKGVVKILDMGLARIEDGDGLTATEQVMGTVDYMSPEQAAETKNADGRSDVYSLGCTLWYLLSAKKLYDGDTMISRLMKHRDAELPSLVKTRDDATWPLEQAFHKMIAKRPQDRYQSMDEVIAALEPFGGGLHGGSSGGMSSSIGGGKGQSAELASFMQAMAGGKSAASSASIAAKPATSAQVDATAAFSSSEIGTDPKSSLHTRGLSSHGAAKPNAGGGRKKRPPLKRIAGGLGGFALLACLGVWVVVRDKDGNVVAEVAVPDGGDVSVRQTTPIVVAPAFAATNATSPAVGSPTLSNTASSGTPSGAAPAAARWPFDPPDGREYVWSAPENLGPGVNGAGNERLAGISGDELAIYFLQRNSTLMVARRARADLPFAAAQPVPGITATGGDADVSGDQRTLAVVQSPDGRRREVWWSERSSLTDAFPPLQRLVSSDRPSGAHCVLSADGLTMLTTNGDMSMWTRAARGAPFTGPQSLPEPVNTPDWDMPCHLSDDLRVIIVMYQFDGSGAEAKRRVRYHTRADRKLPFDAGRSLDVPLGPAEDSDRNSGFRLSGDGRSVYFSSVLYPGGQGNEDLWVSRRVPQDPPATTTATTPPSLAVADLLESADYVWSPPENLGPNVNTPGGEFSAALSADELCLIFHGDGAPGGESNLWECRRPSIDEPFGPRQRLTGSAYEFDAALSADGLTLFYETHAVPAGRVAKDLRIRTRTSPDAPWNPPVTLELDADHDDQTPWLSDDGSTLIFSSNRPGTLGPSDLWLARRKAPDAPFTQVTRLGNGVNTPASEQYGRILADGRTIQFVRDGKPHLTFTSPTGVTSALPMRGVGDDVRVPWISADGRRMYFQSDRPGGLGNADLWMSRRVPKGSAPAGAAPEPGNSPPAETSSIAELLASPDYEWTEPETLGPEVNLGDVNMSPVVSSDGLELWFASYGGSRAKVQGQGGEDLWIARRQSRAAPWEPAKNVGPPINHAGKDVNPALSADGLRLVFWRYPEYTLYESERATTAAPWSEPVNLSAQLGGNINHPRLSADGLELLFSTVPGGKLRRSTRPARDAAWGKPTDLPQLSGTLEAAALWVSPDGRGMLGYWLKSRSPNVYEYWLAERSTPAAPWSAPRRVEFPESLQEIARPYPVLTPTGLELYFVRNQKIHVARRVPKTGAVSLKSPSPAVAPFAAAQAKAHQQAWAAHLGTPVEKEIELPGGERMTFVLIPPGEFTMGSSNEDRALFLKKAAGLKAAPQLIPSEGPPHLVRLPQAFYLSATEVTQSQWQAVMGTTPWRSNPDHRNDAANAAGSVPWEQAKEFCSRASRSDQTLRLPTEAEWEYACRAGTTTAYGFGGWDDMPGEPAGIRNHAWFYHNTRTLGNKYPHGVGQKLPNGWGLFDMHGNVWEWCSDWYGADYYALSPGVDPTGPSAGSLRVLRGGAWAYEADFARSGFRYGLPADAERNAGVGFRVAMTFDMVKLSTTPQPPPDQDAAAPPSVTVTPQDLLKTVTTDTQGVLRFESGVGNAGGAPRFFTGVAVPEEYRLEVDLERASDSGPTELVLVVGGNACSATLESNSANFQRRSGLGLLDGKASP